MDPTPTCDSSISSSSSAAALDFTGFEDREEGVRVEVVGVEVGTEANVLADLNPGGADASTMAS
jgi:hypothetical protein